MKEHLAMLIGLLPLTGRAQAQLPRPGETYVAKMGNACAETSTGGCWKTFYYRLRFGRNTVAVTWVVEMVCSGPSKAATTSIDISQTQRHAYYRLKQPQQLAIAGFRLAPLALTVDGLIGQRPPAEGGGQVVFELESTPTRP